MNYIIPLNGWAASRWVDYRWKADTEFFQEFDNQEILEAGITVAAHCCKQRNALDVDLDLQGWVKVQCDRCLSDLVLPVDEKALLRIAVGAPAPSGEDRELMIPEATASQVDLSQVIYDYVCLSLPLQKVHPEGECDSEMLRFLGRGAEDEEAAQSSPFDALKGLFNA